MQVSSVQLLSSQHPCLISFSSVVVSCKLSNRLIAVKLLLTIPTYTVKDQKMTSNFKLICIPILSGIGAFLLSAGFNQTAVTWFKLGSSKYNHSVIELNLHGKLMDSGLIGVGVAIIISVYLLSKR